MKSKSLFILLLVVLITISCGAKQVTSDQIIASFKAKGLEAENSTPMTKDDYKIAPYVYKGTHFFVPSIDATAGGRIFICENTSDRDLISNYYINLGKQSAAFYSWVFIKGNIVVQINGDLPEATARQYEAAIP